MSEIDDDSTGKITLKDLNFLADKDVIRFFIYTAIIIILSQPLMETLERSWHTGWIYGATVIGPFITNATIGFIVGSIVLMYLDRKKRIQAGILTLGLIVIIFFTVNKFPNIKWVALYLLIGFVLGILAGGGYKKHDNYRKAALNVSIISIIYILIAYLNFYWSSQEETANIAMFSIDSIVVIGFAYFFGTVMNYKGKGKRIFIIGPGASGKTVFMVGCYDTIQKTAKIPPDPNNHLLDAVKELYSPGTETSSSQSLSDLWIGETETTQEYEFKCEVGNLFPKDVLFRTTDWAGALLKYIPDYMYQPMSSDNSDTQSKKLSDIAREIIASDKLIFVIDADKYPDKLDYIIYYVKIINSLKEHGKTFEPYIIVTKSDRFMDEFKIRDYDRFKSYVENKLGRNVFITMLFVQTGINPRHLYPVFFNTQMTEKGKRKPLRDDNGNVFTFGFDEFISILMR